MDIGLQHGHDALIHGAWGCKCAFNKDSLTILEENL